MFQVILVVVVVVIIIIIIIISYELLLWKLNDCGLSAVYMSLFHSYLVHRMPHVHYGGALFAPYEVLSGVPQ
jgi:hypothetical protein